MDSPSRRCNDGRVILEEKEKEQNKWKKIRFSQREHFLARAFYLLM